MYRQLALLAPLRLTHLEPPEEYVVLAVGVLGIVHPIAVETIGMSKQPGG
jgi:hypothetical protein